MSTVGVNLLWLDPGVVGGSEEYTVQLLRAVHTLRGRTNGICLYGHEKLFRTYPELLDCFRCVTSPAFGSKRSRVAAEHSWLARQTFNDAVVHHAGGTVPFLRTTPTIVTVFDLQPLELPENFSRLKRRWLHAMIPRSTSAARAVICLSNHTAQRISSLLRVEPNRLSVVPHGCEPPADSPQSAVDDMRRRFGRFLLYPAITYPHKRHTDVINVLHQLRESMADLSVVFTGRPGPETEALRDQVRRLALDSRVHFLGRVPQKQLDTLYRSALATIFPSAYEGFGIPALEAMVRGCPLIVSDAGSLPEVVGSAAEVVPVGDVGEFAKRVQQVGSDSEHAKFLTKAGLARSADFPWSGAAESLLAVYDQCVGDYVRPR